MDHRTRPDPLRAGVAIRQRLYLASALVALVGAVVEGGAAWVGLVVVFCAGAVVGWLRLGSARRRVVAMFGFEQLAGIWLAAAGFPLAGFAVALGSVIATSLTLPAEPAVRWVGAVAAGVIGVLEVPDTGVGTVFRVGAVIALTWGLAVLFRVAGFEIEHHHRLLSEWPHRQRRLMDTAPEPMVVYRKGEILYANPAAARIVEVDSPEDLIGRHVLEFIDPDDEPLAVERMARVAAGESLEPAHLRIRTVNGHLRHVETTAYRTDWEGEVAVHLILRDRTEVEQTRAELAALFHRLPVALYRSTPEGEVIAGNPALAELLGYPDVDTLLNNREAANRAYPDLARREFWRDLMDREGTVLGFEQEMVRWDGSRIWVSDSAVAVRDDRGEIAYYEGAMVDITDRIRVEKSRRRLLDIVEATSELIGLCDRSGTLIYANPALRRFLWGNTVGPFRPIHVARVLGADTVRAVEDALRRNGRWKGEAVVRLDGVERVVSGSVLIHGLGDDEFLSLVGRDVTEERNTARRLEQLIRAKDEFVAAVSHELRTPLTAVVGMALELRDNESAFGEDERRDLVALIAEQAQEVSHIVEDLLVAARADTDTISLVVRPVDVAEAVDAAVRALPTDARSQVANKAWGVVRADPGRVRQILRNLLTNAIRYGGPNIEVRTTEQGGFLATSVADDGPGIPEEMWERIFEPFERAHRVDTQPNSVGLGLTVSRWLARKMGGDLVYHHADESVFTLILPEA